MTRELKSFDPGKWVISSVAVVNETPGSRREIAVEDLGKEIARMRGRPAK